MDIKQVLHVVSIMMQYLFNVVQDMLEKNVVQNVILKKVSIRIQIKLDAILYHHHSISQMIIKYMMLTPDIIAIRMMQQVF